jgi:type III secretion protein V
LLVAISAGILITRSGDTNDDVGAQVGKQFFAQPRAMQMAGGLIFLLALIPGFPKPQLFTLAAAVFLFGKMLSYAKSNRQKPGPEEQLQKTLAPMGGKRPASSSKTGEEFAPTVPIILDISPDIATAMDYDSLNGELVELRRALYFDLGVPFPGINIRPNPNLSSFAYVLNLNEIPLATGQLLKDHVIVREKRSNLDLLGISYIEGDSFLPGVESLWVPKEDQVKLAKAGIVCMEHSRILAYHLSLLLTRHASSFIGMQETKFLLDRMEERAPDLVREATRLLPIQRISDIFQRLVQEQVSIRDLRMILQALIDWAPKEKDAVMLTEYVRGALKRQISYMYSKGQNMLPVILMEPTVEETVRKAIRQTSAGAFLSLDPQTSQRILNAVGDAAGKYRHSTQKPVLMVSMDIRRYVRRLIEPKFYELSVMAYQEVTPEISVQPVARIHL